jgi:hypothetical protein
MNLTKLQHVLANAERTEAHLAAIKRQVSKITPLLEELSAMLQDDYQPAVKERKPRAPRAEGAKRPGRPRKDASQAA